MSSTAAWTRTSSTPRRSAATASWARPPPLTLRRDSMLGVPGLVNVYREGNVAIANAPGAGVADDKAVYAYMPALIQYYLDAAPLLGQVSTYVGLRKNDFAFILDNLARLVVKTTGESGGY